LLAQELKKSIFLAMEGLPRPLPSQVDLFRKESDNLPLDMAMNDCQSVLQLAQIAFQVV
jgi:hypothetical protein